MAEGAILEEDLKHARQSFSLDKTPSSYRPPANPLAVSGREREYPQEHRLSPWQHQKGGRGQQRRIWVCQLHQDGLVSTWKQFL